MSRQCEIEAVRKLGEEIGYGNMMDIASALWAINMTMYTGKDAICHVPTILECMKKKDAKQKAEEVRCRVNEIKAVLNIG